MCRAERRKVKHGQETAAGSLGRELKEIQKLQRDEAVEGIFTITAGCGAIFTIICC